MKRAELKVQPRPVRNRSLNRGLRKFGRVPAIVYGSGFKNSSLSFEEKEIRKIIDNDWSANFIFTFDSEDGSLKGKQVVVKNVERDPVTWKLTHIDFYELSFDKKLTVSIPIFFTGIPEGVKLEGGMLNVLRRSVRVRALPNDLPEKFEYDISALKIGDNVHVEDLNVAENVSVLDAPQVTLVSVSEQAEEEIVTPTATEGAEGAVPKAEGAEGAVPKAEGGEAKKDG